MEKTNALLKLLYNKLGARVGALKLCVIFEFLRKKNSKNSFSRASKNINVTRFFSGSKNIFT